MPLSHLTIRCLHLKRLHPWSTSKVRGTRVQCIQEEVLERTSRLPSFDTAQITQKTTPTILSFRGNLFTEPLPSSNKAIHKDKGRRHSLTAERCQNAHRLPFDTTRTAQEKTRRTHFSLPVFVSIQNFAHHSGRTFVRTEWCYPKGSPNTNS
jgi:hypothetical protein